MKLIIPNKDHLIPLEFEYIDQTIDQYYRPIQGYFMRKRLALALDFLARGNPRRVDRILDVGYGGGTFLVALSRLAKKVYGIDLHTKTDIVKKILKRDGVTGAVLRKDSIFKTQFSSAYFDRIACISVMEHFRDKELNEACREMKRILKKDGFVVFGFPTKNIFSNFIIQYILKFTPDDIHPSGHRDILRAISRNFSRYEVISYPKFLPLDLALYVVVKAIA